MQAKKIMEMCLLYVDGMNTGRPSKRLRTPFGERLHASREERGFSQAQVAQLLGISQNAYACWERNPVALRPEQIAQVAKILTVSVETLFGENSNLIRRGGPTGKAQRVFEEVSHLPRKRQQRIISVVEDLLAVQRTNGHKQAA